MMKQRDRKRFVIVGGGIAGLYAAYLLKRSFGDDVHVDIYEATTRPGGRIKTVRLKNDNTVLSRKELEEADERGDIRDQLEFHAEFGPMRLELDTQHLLDALLRDLKFERAKTGVDLKSFHLEDFPAYASPNAPHDPAYPLAADEQGKSPMELFELALLRVVTQLRLSPQPDSTRDDYASQLAALLSGVGSDSTQMARTNQSPGKLLRGFARRLNSAHLWEVQTRGHVGGVPLYTLGFWNLISDQISHNATRKIRELGSFYHLLDENPNAAEWLAWWLAGLAISDRLKGVAGGMETIVERLYAELKLKEADPDGSLGDNWRIFMPHLVTRLVLANGKLHVLSKREDPNKHAEPVPETLSCAYDGVVLALPRRPLETLLSQSLSSFDASMHGDVLAWLDSAFAFPLVKVFAVVDRRWWEEDFRPNVGATLMPTREVHYWKGNTGRSRQGMIMVYTDRPSSAVWGNFVASGPHVDVWARRLSDGAAGGATIAGEEDRGYDPPNPFSQRQRLRKKLAEVVRAQDSADMKPDDISWVGIRDWGRDPCGGNHAWRPKRRYWHVMWRLAHLATSRAVPQSGGSSQEKLCPPRSESSGASVHVCGEAYSDYHGFIEGALRSALLAVTALARNHLESEDSWEQRSKKLLDRCKPTCDELDSDADRRRFDKRFKEHVQQLSWWTGQVLGRGDESGIYGYGTYPDAKVGRFHEELQRLDEAKDQWDRLEILQDLAEESADAPTDEIEESYLREFGSPEDVRASKEFGVLRSLARWHGGGIHRLGPDLVERVFRDVTFDGRTPDRLRQIVEALARLRRGRELAPASRPDTA